MTLSYCSWFFYCTTFRSPFVAQLVSHRVSVGVFLRMDTLHYVHLFLVDFRGVDYTSLIVVVAGIAKVGQGGSFWCPLFGK